MKLTIPPEPKEIKVFMEKIHKTIYNTPGINWPPAVIWVGNKLPKYFWDHWKTELKSAGFTWQKFMRLMRYRTDNALAWYWSTISWKAFAETVKELIEGPAGKEILK